MSGSRPESYAGVVSQGQKSCADLARPNRIRSAIPRLPGYAARSGFSAEVPAAASSKARTAMSPVRSARASAPVTSYPTMILLVHGASQLCYS